MNQRNNLMTILVLGTVLVMAAAAVAPGVAYGQLINAEIANVDCEQEQKSEQSNEQKSEEILLSEQENEQSNEASQDCSAVDVF